MSITPDKHYHGDKTCRCCGKEMTANDAGVTYHTFRNKHDMMNDLMFCVECAVDVTRAMVQDIRRIDPEVVYQKHWYADELNRYARVLRELADHAEGVAGVIEFERGMTANMEV